MPIRTSYAKKIRERRGKVTEPTPTIKRKHRPTKDTKWMIMRNGKQIGEPMNTPSECYEYIQQHDLKWTSIQRID